MKSSSIRSGLWCGLVAAAVVAATYGAESPARASGSDGDRVAPLSFGGASTGARLVAASSAVKSSATPLDSADGKGATCPTGTVEVEGDYCSQVEQTCVRWLDPDTKMRCAEFSPETKCIGQTVHKHFCIDRFEYPNQPGEKPVVMKTWYEARDACRAEGKRLCGSGEWTLACEGQERLPYPYGFVRNAEACNIDKPHPDVNEKALADPRTRDAEAARLDQRDPSAAREGCVSPFGVHDMTGNVDEWVVNDSGNPYQSGLKGGYWGPVRTRCRPMTTVHSELFSFYQIGFRCCADAGAPSVKGPASPSGSESVRGGNPGLGALTGI